MTYASPSSTSPSSPESALLFPFFALLDPDPLLPYPLSDPDLSAGSGDREACLLSSPDSSSSEPASAKSSSSISAMAADRLKSFERARKGRFRRGRVDFEMGRSVVVSWRCLQDKRRVWTISRSHFLTLDKETRVMAFSLESVEKISCCAEPRDPVGAATRGRGVWSRELRRQRRTVDVGGESRGQGDAALPTS